MNLLGKTAPQFATGATWTQSGTTFTNGDLRVTYALPTGITDSETADRPADSASARSTTRT